MIARKISSADNVTSDSNHPELSKTKRKAAMLALQSFGGELAQLAPKRLAELALPDHLVTALLDYQRMNKWGAKNRQMQYIGRLMREIDVAPIQMKLAEWARGPNADRTEFHAIERWRERLLLEPKALDELSTLHPGLDRMHFKALIERAREEQQRSDPPRYFRQLFRELKTLLETAQGDEQ